MQQESKTSNPGTWPISTQGHNSNRPSMVHSSEVWNKPSSFTWDVIWKYDHSTPWQTGWSLLLTTCVLYSDELNIFQKIYHFKPRKINWKGTCSFTTNLATRSLKTKTKTSVHSHLRYLNNHWCCTHSVSNHVLLQINDIFLWYYHVHKLWFRDWAMLMRAWCNKQPDLKDTLHGFLSWNKVWRISVPVLTQLLLHCH